MDFLKSQQGKSTKNGRLPKKAAILHKIPEFVGGAANLDDNRFSFERKRKKENNLFAFIYYLR
ncbi:hypothetical protein ACNKHM_09685 [Shigella sonnei]